ETARILEDVHRAFLGWRRRPITQRARAIGDTARVLRAKKAAYARTMALEMGKPIAQGEGEVEKCAWGCEYYAEHAEEFLAPQPRRTDARRSYVRFDPLGPVLAIMPWNFPFWQVFRFAAPALVAGNAGILKHASNVPRCALEIEQVFREAGLPERVFRQVEESVRRGAEVVLGGRVPEAPGAFYPPTVLVAVRRGMPAFDEETFGPVAAVIRARDEAEAIALGNDSPYGLGASLWTRHDGRAERLAGEIEAGCVFVNGQVRSDPRLPFGGIKRSGYGRELSEYGIREFVNIKSVAIF